MAKTSVTANSQQTQIDQLNQSFANVKSKAAQFEKTEAKATDLLHQALADVYEFGLDLYDQSKKSGENITRTFIEANKVTFNKRIRENPFLGLVKLAFVDRSDSSVSQYSTVLRHASATKVPAADFYAKLKARGIKDWLNEAVSYFGGTAHANNTQAKLARFTRAEKAVLGMPASSAVALPQGIVAPEGFAIVLARIDSANNAAIVDVLQHGQDELEPVILRYDPTNAPVPLTGEMARFHRAIDLLLAVTGQSVTALAIRNEVIDGGEVCRVDAVSTNAGFVGGSVIMEGFFGSLPVNQTFMLTDQDAQAFVDAFARYDNWVIEGGELIADKLEHGIAIKPLPARAGLKRAIITPGQHRLTMSVDEQQSVVSFIDRERKEHERRGKEQKTKASFAKQFNATVVGGHLRLSLPTSLMEVDAATTSPDRPLDHIAISVDDLRQALETTVHSDVGMTGGFLDTDTDDAAIILQSKIGEDQLVISLPTQVGSSYNENSEALA